MPWPFKKEIKYELVGLILIALALLALASFLTPGVGKIGQSISRLLELAAGNGRYLAPFFLAFLGVRLLMKHDFSPSIRSAGLVIMFVTFLTLLHLGIAPEESFSAARQGLGGGFIGALPAYIILPYFGIVGAYIVLVVLFLAGVMLFTGSSLVTLFSNIGSRIQHEFLRFKGLLVNFIFTEDSSTSEGKRKKNKPPSKGTWESLNEEDKKSSPINTIVPFPAKSNENKLGEEEQISEDVTGVDTNAGTLIRGCQKLFYLPSTSMLKPLSGKSSSSKKTGANSTQLKQILESFGIKVNIANVSVGPAITRYEIQPPPGIKVSRIAGLADDIALGMAAPGVRIEAPIPGKAAVGIEVPNLEIEPVQLRELLENKEFANNPSRLSVALGKDIAGSPVVADLSRMPHMLIAGATGSGKSVCVNTIICSILFKATPDEVKFMMVDPKMVELASYNGIPHLVSPVVTDAKKAAGALRWAVKEMERRYELFATAGVRDISRYNQLYLEEMQRNAATKNSEPVEAAETAENTHSPLPFIVIIIDELADLMMVVPGDVEDAICRLAQMARACGMHLVVATQRPSVDVITGLIKANIPSRISFAVSSQTDSRTILDTGGAEKLLGKGDMLFYPVGASKPLRVQGAYLSDEEVEAVVEFLKEQARPVYNEEVLTMQPESQKNDDAREEWDDLLPQAAQVFIESGTASISMLQRRLHIGYSRAARIIDILERRGIVGGYEGSKPRQVLMTWDQYQQVFGEKQSQAN